MAIRLARRAMDGYVARARAPLQQHLPSPSTADLQPQQSLPLAATPITSPN